MAGRQGDEKFDKYFRGKHSVEVFAKGKPKGRPVSVFSSVDSKVIVETIPDGTRITVFPDKSYEGRYRAKYGSKDGFISDINVGKPKENSSNLELDRITATDFIATGNRVSVCYDGHLIECVSFKSSKNLSTVIIHGLANIRGVSLGIRETFQNMLLSKKPTSFEWHDSVTGEEMNKFGVYFGELLTGYYILSEQFDVFSETKPWMEEASEFLIPVDPSFSGVDSFVRVKGGELVPISNKFGTGAAASFFSNLLIGGMKCRDSLKRSVFSSVVSSAVDVGVTIAHLEKKQKAKPILYEFGIRKILKLKRQDVPDTGAVLGYIKQQVNNPARFKVMNGISKYAGLDRRILDGLENTSTAFFCRETASLLMNDSVSVNQMLDILTGKNYWQANLNEASWRKGIVKFNIRNSGESKLEIIGSKASMTDLDASQGMINYILK